MLILFIFFNGFDFSYWIIFFICIFYFIYIYVYICWQRKILIFWNQILKATKHLNFLWAGDWMQMYIYVYINLFISKCMYIHYWTDCSHTLPPYLCYLLWTWPSSVWLFAAALNSWRLVFFWKLLCYRHRSMID